MATELTIYCHKCRRETTRVVSIKEPHELAESEIAALSLACGWCRKVYEDVGELYSVAAPSFF